jgi:hypothetical protein
VLGKRQIHIPYFIALLVAQELWNFVFNIFGIHWVMPSWVLALLECWWGAYRSSRIRELRKMIPHCIFGCVWWERNSRSFEGIEWSVLELKWSLIHILWEWNNAYGVVSFHYVLEFLDFCTM